MEYNGSPRVPGNNDIQVNRNNQKPMAKRNPKKLLSRPMQMVFGAFFVAVAILATSVIILMSVGGGNTESELIKKDKYQAVFLSDASGQVYFGKLKSLNAKYYQLTDIYYVKVENAVQPDKTNTASQSISLAKLGNELHGPEDIMYISRDKVLFWENLKDDGQVVKAITEYKKNGGPTNSSSSQSQSSTPQGTSQSQSNSTQNSGTNNTTNKNSSN